MRWQGTTSKTNAKERGQGDLPFGLASLVLGLALKVRLSTLGLAVARLLVDVDLFAVLGSRRRAAVLFLDDADLFLDVRVARRLLLLLVDGGSEGCVRLFVLFPSVCLRLR